ncbi:MAG TPA: sugar ABC transporter permease [Solirubrobacteraceae bacterium]|nr:sugar ABC transporter permease [Solirubrobacteraceae bacterium]
MTRHMPAAGAAQTATGATPAPPAAARRPPRRRRLTLRGRRQAVGALMAAPAVLLITVFFLVPLGLTFYMSLNQWSLLGAHTWIGLENYTRAFSDQGFRDAFMFTLEYTAVITPILFLIGLGLALLVRRPRRGARFFQSVYFLPVVIGFAASSFLWLYLAQPSVGPLFDIFKALGLADENTNWFANKGSALLVVVASITWKIVGMQMLLLLAGLQSIPVEVEEAARIDGAGRWQTFRYITLPLLRPTLALVLVFSVAGSLLAFDQFFIMTNGGPNNTTITAVYEIYRVSFVQFQLGYGAALSVLLMVVLAAVSAVQLMLLRNTDHN